MSHILFHAPLKPADHPDPSGDRSMARLLIAALSGAGFEVETASSLRMYDRQGDAALMQDLEARALAEAEALAAEIAGRAPAGRPALMFTYHVYYKAPDVLGPALARRLGIPYCIVEGSRSPKQAAGRWARGHALAETALDAAGIVFVLNGRDRPALEAARPPGQRLIDLPPFIDAGSWPPPPDREPLRPGEPATLLVAAMMRAGDKLVSYRLLSEALALARDLPWRLVVAGDGPARSEVEALLAPFGDRVSFLGRCAQEALAAAYLEADLLVWPAVNEAFGMVFLEAAACGCPAIAGRFGGVPDVVRDGWTGRIVAGGSAEAFSAGLRDLLGDPAGLRALARQAADFARGERDIDGAAAILSRELGPLLRPATEVGR